MSRLFKKTPSCPCPCETIICEPGNCQPAAPVPQTTVKPDAKVMCEPAHPGDWRESWGKVEPWKSTYNPKESVTIQPMPATSDPLNGREFHRDMATNTQPSSSKLPVETYPAMPPSVEMKTEEHVVLPDSVPPEGAPSPTSRSPGRVVSLPANEANAFWTPPTPPPADKLPHPKYNAFERDPNDPPRNDAQPGMPGGPQGPMPMGPMPMMMPPRPPMPPPMVDSGVPEAMGNAFTLAGTRRPIPADFGGTPQEENGFGIADMEPRGGQGIPPRPYGMTPTAGSPRPSMPNPMPLPPNGPMVPAPGLMNMPPAGMMPGSTAAVPKAASVPQLLATLKDSLYPSQREIAAERLSELDARKNPQVVGSLVKAAKDDPAATVRAACVHALADMKLHTPEVEALVRSLKQDSDARVRHEAEEAMAALGLDTGIQQTSHK
jgi:HEAT repeats